MKTIVQMYKFAAEYDPELTPEDISNIEQVNIDTSPSYGLRPLLGAALGGNIGALINMKLAITGASGGLIAGIASARRKRINELRQRGYEAQSRGLFSNYYTKAKEPSKEQ